MRVLNSSINSSNEDLLYSFTNGIEVDSLLFRQEIQVQKQWVIALNDIGLFNADETKSILMELDVVAELMGTKKFDWKVADEDIHMNIERHLTDKLGDLGKKIHLGRSRNDLIATTLRLYTRDSLQVIDDQLTTLKRKVHSKAESWKNLIVPGLTHVQAGMPVGFKVILSAHEEALKRDLVRILDAQSSCMDSCPFGAAAFAGTHLNINLDQLATQLGFASSVQNTYDAVGDRDFILQTLNCFSLIGVHLSRLCEELIYYSSSFVGLIELPAQLSTGSSIMPNKRNPDVIELVRAKMAKVMACASEGANLVKAVLPSYGSDLHELKETLVRATQELQQSLEIMIPFMDALGINEQKAKKLCRQGHVLATDIANFLCQSGKSFRDSYATVAAMVESAETEGCQVHERLKGEEEISFWNYLNQSRGLVKTSF